MHGKSVNGVAYRAIVTLTSLKEFILQQIFITYLFFNMLLPLPGTHSSPLPASPPLSLPPPGILIPSVPQISA